MTQDASGAPESSTPQEHPAVAGSRPWSQLGEPLGDSSARGARAAKLTAQVGGLGLLVAVLAFRANAWLAAAAALIGVVMVAFEVRSSGGGPLGRFVERVAEVVARVVAAVLLTVLWVVGVLVPWVFQGIARLDPLWTPRSEGSRWVALADVTTPPNQLWTVDRRRRRTTGGRRIHRAVAWFVALLLVLASIGGWFWRDQLRRDHARYTVPALADSPWWPAMSDAVDVAYGRSPISSFTGGVQMLDVRYPGFNVTDARRHSWTPPGSRCSPVTVWMFGGSTMFGLGQRDDHTIPSELARLAWKDGVPLRVENFGVPADMFWMETRRLELALADGLATPDLVIFYDGTNDFRVQANLNAHGRGGTMTFPNDLDATALPDIQRRNERLAFLMELTRGGPAVSSEPEAVLSQHELAVRAAASYAETADFIEPFLAARDIPWVQFYQPSRVTREVALDSERSPDGSDDSFWEPIESEFRARLGDHVVDISDAMDSSAEPIYYDELHTNELGAARVAEAMYPHLAEQLASASARANGSDECG